MRLAVEILAVILLMLVNGVLAMSEMAVVSSRRGRLEQMAAQGNRSAAAVVRLLEDPTRFLSTVQVGITLVGILAGAFSGATLGHYLAAALEGLGLPPGTTDTLAIATVVLVITYLSLIVGELVPKRLALANPEAIACRIAPTMGRLADLAGPVVWLLRASTNALIAVLGLPAHRASKVTEDEVRALLAESAEAGVIKKTEHEMIVGIMRIADRPTRSIMTPRVDVVWLDAGDGPAELRAAIEAAGHSRYPVCRGKLDEVVGVLHVRRLVGLSLEEAARDLTALAAPPLIVPESTPVLRLVEQFRRTPTHMAVVIDEYGAVEGVVTPADVLAAIAGELPEGHEDEPAEAVRREDGSWLVDGRMEIHAAERVLGIAGMAHAADEYTTVAGFVLWQLGRIPKVGQRLTWRGYVFEVVDLDGRRIDKVLVVPA